PDCTRDMIRARSREQERFGRYPPSLARWVEEQRTDGLGPRCAARLAREQNLQPPVPQRPGEHARLGGLAGTLPALQRDEAATSHVSRPRTPFHRRMTGLARATDSAATSGTSCGSSPSTVT